MMIIRFFEKDDDRDVEGPDRETILAQILRERIEDTYDRVFGAGSGSDSIWYGDDTVNAQEALDNGRAVQYMMSRRRHEYEDWQIEGITQ